MSLLVFTRSATSMKEKLSYTIPSHWMRHGPYYMNHQSNERRHYGSPRKSKVCQNPQQCAKAMVILVYNYNGVILAHAVPQHKTVTAQYYFHFQEHSLRPALTKKRRHYSEPTHHFEWQCLSISCAPAVHSMGLGSAQPPTLVSWFKHLWLQLDP